MTTKTTPRIDHVGWANGFMQDAERPFDPNDPDVQQERESATIEENLAFAQVHATLALVDAQHTANLIAYVQFLEKQYAAAADRPEEFDWESRAASEERHRVAVERIRERLGL